MGGSECVLFAQIDDEDDDDEIEIVRSDLLVEEDEEYSLFFRKLLTS